MSETTKATGGGGSYAGMSYEELLANPPTNVRRKVPLPQPAAKAQRKAVLAEVSPRMHDAVSVAERTIRQGTEQLRAKHVEEMRAAAKGAYASYYRAGPMTSDGVKENARIRAIIAHWHEVQRFAEATVSELWEVHRQCGEEEKERLEKTKEKRMKNFRWVTLD